MTSDPFGARLVIVLFERQPHHWRCAGPNIHTPRELPDGATTGVSP